MTIQNPIVDSLPPMNETDLRDMLDDVPRSGNFNPTDEVVEELLAQIQNDDGLSPADAQALQNHLDAE